jgi:hypothetical protein
VRIAYLILAHNNAAHLARLIARLRAPDCHFYVHIDAKADLAPFRHLAGPAVTLCERRVDGTWGDMSLVEATLEMMRCAAAEPAGFDYVALLSGACYPLRTPAYIADFLERHRGAEFIEAFPMPDPAYGKPIERLTRYWIRKGAPLARLRWPLQRLLNRWLPPRDYQRALAGNALAAGSQWWCISGAAMRHVLDYDRAHPAFHRFCRLVDCPDEFFFQYILWNSPFRARISHSLTYTRWRAGNNGPETIDAGYLPEFDRPVIVDAADNNCPNEKREVLFARKFNDASAPLLDRIDQLAERHAGAGAAHGV